MEELNNILDMIVDFYNSSVNVDKFKIISDLWTRYYKRSMELNLELDRALQIQFMYDNICYKVNSKSVRNNFSSDNVVVILEKLNKDGYISKIEADFLVSYVVEKVRRSLESLGVDIDSNTLSGYCDIAQYLSISFFEKNGFIVTKNKCMDCFDYNFNHYFGVVNIPICENKLVKDQGYLIDCTYKQFFTSTRCNEGRYYAWEYSPIFGKEIIANPDPGYFVDDVDFASELIANGFVLFDELNAKKYGEPFYLSSLNIDDKPVCRDYYNDIIKNGSDYGVSPADVADLEIDIPNVIKYSR